MIFHDGDDDDDGDGWFFSSNVDLHVDVHLEMGTDLLVY